MKKFYTKRIRKYFCDIYVSIYVSLHMLSYLHCKNNNSQHLMLAIPEKHNIYIHKFEQELLSTIFTIVFIYYPLINYGVSGSNS